MMGRVLIVLLLGVATACSTTGNTVTMEPSQRFEPETIEVRVGEAVTFVNESAEAHTVTADQDALPRGARYFASGGFSSEADARADVARGLLKEGETYRVAFDTPGTYEYLCIPHEDDNMKGRIVVTE